MMADGVASFTAGSTYLKGVGGEPPPHLAELLGEKHVGEQHQEGHPQSRRDRGGRAGDPQAEYVH